MKDRAALLSGSRRIVVKVGTTQITEAGAFSPAKLDILAAALAGLRQQQEIVLVSSGAVSAGIAAAGLQIKKSLSIPYKQAAAAIGQSVMMSEYARAFRKRGITIGQVLLTKDVMQSRERYRNACNTLATLLKLGVLPIVNENDTMVIDEIKVGDNDRLAAMVAQLVAADLLVLLSDVDGFYRDFGTNHQERLSVVESLDSAVRSLARSEGSKYSTGGMITKLDAAEMCQGAGIHTVIAAGEDPAILARIIAGEDIGTLFPAGTRALPGKKHWIRHHLVKRGRLVIDSGAARALLEQGKSLLAKGIIAVHGNFSEGDGVTIEHPAGTPVATGICNYGREELVKIMGHESAAIEGILGRKSFDEVVHRDHLLLTAGDNSG